MGNISRVIWTIIRILFAIFMIFAGIQHFLKSDFYLPFVPGFLPFPMLIIYVSGIVEIGLGLLLLFKKYSRVAAMGVLILMLLFLPIHIYDIFSDIPAIGSHKAALIRLPIQFLFIAIAWKLKQLSRNK